ncbi:hypothetical protein AB0368_37805 [Actinoplanes sp. NPDC051475]|uniref:hypothetical protein n=1 Tax=Actinoplanes sp. NPDC051475 TaxID=3157225 RepID=UPI00344CD815
MAVLTAALACAAPTALPSAAVAAARPTVVISGKLAGHSGAVLLAVGRNSAS